jgi:predicted ATPase
MELVGKRFLGISNRSKNESDAHLQLEPNSTVQIENIVEFMANAFIRCTMHADLVLLSLDDVQWMDESSWKVVQRIFERASNLLIFSGSRMPSTNLTLDPTFLSDLLTQHQAAGRYYEMSLPPFNEAEVKEFIACALNSSTDDVDDSFSNSVWTTSGGMPLYLSHVLDAIQRNNLTVRLDNGMIGMKSTDEDDRKVSVLYR